METISPVYARLVLRELERRGLETAPLFAGTSLVREELLSGTDIAMADFLHMLQVGDRLLGGEQLGFLLGRQMHVFAMGPLGSALASAPSLRDGLQLLENFSRLHATYIDIRARSTLRGLTVTILYAQETGTVERFHTQAALVLLQQYLETLAGAPVDDAHYQIALPEPADPRAYAAALNGSISFGAEANEVEVPARLLDLTSPYYHAALWREARASLARSLEAQSTQAGTPYTAAVFTLLSTSKPPLPELGDVAAALHVSERTLNRRLQAEGGSFRELKSRALISRARQYLGESRFSIDAIAQALGYTDAANFRRAFRKVTGCSPSTYRARLDR
jgi:AraC-like DNA-binding protein